LKIEVQGGAPWAYSHILVGASVTPARPVIQRFTASDLFQALSRGFDDFSANTQP